MHLSEGAGESTMNTQQNLAGRPDMEIGSFDDIQEIEYVKFDEGLVRVRFDSDEFLVTKNAFNSITWLFAVVEGKRDKRLAVTSKRLVLKLKALHPLGGKVCDIERVGAGMDTDYTVKEVE